MSIENHLSDARLAELERKCQGVAYPGGLAPCSAADLTSLLEEVRDHRRAEVDRRYLCSQTGCHRPAVAMWRKSGQPSMPYCEEHRCYGDSPLPPRDVPATAPADDGVADAQIVQWLRVLRCPVHDQEATRLARGSAEWAGYVLIRCALCRPTSDAYSIDIPPLDNVPTATPEEVVELLRAGGWIGVADGGHALVNEDAIISDAHPRHACGQPLPVSFLSLWALVLTDLGVYTAGRAESQAADVSIAAETANVEINEVTKTELYPQGIGAVNVTRIHPQSDPED